MPRRMLVVGTAVYVLIVAAGVFGPAPGEPVREAGDSLRELESDIRSVAPGRQSAADHTRRQRSQRTGPIVAGLTTEELGNVAMFVPLGVLLALLWPQRRWLAIPIGVTASTAIELLQVALPWRSPSLNDIRWNSVGTTVGFGIVMVTVLVARTIRDDSGGAHAA